MAQAWNTRDPPPLSYVLYDQGGFVTLKASGPIYVCVVVCEHHVGLAMYIP